MKKLVGPCSWAAFALLVIAAAGCYGDPPPGDESDPLPNVYGNKDLDPSVMGFDGHSHGMNMGPPGAHAHHHPGEGEPPGEAPSKPTDPPAKDGDAKANEGKTDEPAAKAGDKSADETKGQP